MINQITERIYIGDASDGQNIETWRPLGINAIMNATSQTDNLAGRIVEDILYIRLNQEDGQPIERKTLHEFLEWMEWVLSWPQRRVLIHCGAGKSRAPSFTIAWLMRNGFGWDEAEALVRSKREIINPNPVLKKSILEFFEKE